MTKKYSLWLLLFLFFSSNSFGGAFIKTFQEGMGTEKLFTTIIDEKKKQLEALQENLKKVQQDSEKFSATAKASLEVIATKAAAVRSTIRQEPQNEEFLNSKLSLLNELYEAKKDRQQAYKQSIEFSQDHISLLQSYLEDPNLENYIKEYAGERKTVYSFENLQELNTMVLVQNNNVGHLEKQEKNATVELESRKYSLDSAIKNHKEKKQEFKDFATSPGEKDSGEMFGFDEKQKRVLLELQEELSFEKSELANVWLDATNNKVEQIKTKLFVARLQRKTLEKLVTIVRPLVTISDQDLAVARTQFNKKKQNSLAIKGKYRWQEEIIAKENENITNELEKISKQYAIALGGKLDEWAVEAKQAAGSYVDLIKLGNLNSQYLFNERKKEILEAQISLEDEKLRYKKLQTDVKTSFHGIKSGKFNSEVEKNKEVEKYDISEVEIAATVAKFKERENAATGLLNAQKRARENIKTFLEDVQKKRSIVFSKSPKEFNQVLMLLKGAKLKVQALINVTEKMIGLYRDIVATSQNARGQIVFIVSELEATISPLSRSEEAIKFEEVKNLYPDIKRFSLDFYTSVKLFSLSSLVNKIKNSFPRTMDLLWLIMKLLLLFIFLFVGRRYIKKGSEWLSEFTQKKGVFVTLIQAFLEFVLHYSFAFFVWIMLFAGIRFGVLPEYGLQMLFYLISIPYFLYFANRFLQKIIVLNQANSHLILTKQFQSRFYFIVSTLLYSTIIIQLFRTAFILGPYQESELPKIIMALNFIIFQVSLIFLITKDQVLNLIPTSTAAWKQAYAQVDKYFYLILSFLIAIIVMINPYVGFGQLVRYVIFRLFLTVILLRLLYWMQAALKKVSSRLFFSMDEDAAKERFDSAKSWYGVFMIFLFLILAFIGFLGAAKIWGWAIKVEDLKTWMTVGRQFSVLSLSKVLGFIAAGFLLAFGFNKFVLRRIFDLLLVEMGIQQAVIGLTRYLIIIALTFVGLDNVGLGELTKWLLGVLLAVAWVIKEPLGDLVAYFILLIQRPLKIGDYVKIDDKTSGVVRRLTPRSIIIRQKNSTTIVVPNSQVLSKAVVNWNYVSGFIALDDIVIKVHFKEDPARIVEFLSKAINEYPNVLKSPKPVVRLENIGEYSFDFLIRCYVSSHFTLDMWTIASDIRLLVIKSLRENDISIALPKSIWVSPEDVEKQKKEIETK